MLLVGSEACLRHGVDLGRTPLDLDFIIEGIRLPALQNFLEAGLHVIDENHAALSVPGQILDLELAWSGSTAATLLEMARTESWPVVTVPVNGKNISAYLPPLSVLLALKLGHRYKKDSPFFRKTMGDILKLRELSPDLAPLGDWPKLREKETLSYQHPNLKRSKGEFFNGDGVPYKYDHDTLHIAVQHLDKPAYWFFAVDGQEVLSSKKLFRKQPKEIQLLAVLEETQVLALERSQIPFNFGVDRRLSFNIAHEKVCTSITSGWFREFAWENFETVQSMYEEGYPDRFHSALAEGVVKPFQGGY
jgi:hypothetical protein